MRFPMINTVATGQNINRMRIGAGMTVKDMQEVFGFTTPQAIYKWIHGTSMPTIDNLVILAAMLGVTLDEIVVVEIAAMKCGEIQLNTFLRRRAGIRRPAQEHSSIV